MDLATFRKLLTPGGQAALAEAAALEPTEAGFLQAFEKLRKRHPAELAKAALETVLLRERARPRHSLADRLYFTREALEQSSGEMVSRYRAGCYEGCDAVLDLCCGVGMDAIQLALAGCRVEAVDNDPLRLAMAEANAAAAGVGDRCRFHLGDVLAMPLPEADAAFFDPSRRIGERRFLAPRDYQPPVETVLARLPAGFPIGVKLAPGIDRRDLEPFDAERDFISWDGELKECVLWFGPMNHVRWHATILTTATENSKRVDGYNLATVHADDPPDDPPAGPLAEYLFDPDSAVIRAGLVGQLAKWLDARPLEPGVALLTGSKTIPMTFASCGVYRVEACLPLRAEKLRDYLREHEIGRLTILKRAVDVDVNAFQHKLKLAGSGHRHLVLTQAGGRTVAIVAVRVSPSDCAGAVQS